VSRDSLTVEQGSFMHEQPWLTVEAKRLDGEVARVSDEAHGLGEGIERRKRHEKALRGRGARQGVLRSRHACGYATVVDRKKLEDAGVPRSAGIEWHSRLKSNPP
jgi:hypothetical protein